MSHATLGIWFLWTRADSGPVLVVSSRWLFTHEGAEEGCRACSSTISNGDRGQPKIILQCESERQKPGNSETANSSSKQLTEVIYQYPRPRRKRSKVCLPRHKTIESLSSVHSYPVWCNTVYHLQIPLLPFARSPTICSEDLSSFFPTLSCALSGRGVHRPPIFFSRSGFGANGIGRGKF